MDSTIDATRALRDAENALRDFIGAVLPPILGPDWIDKCGANPDRVEKWRERKQVEASRQEAGVVEERILYYADFYDLSPILRKHWGHFADALGDFKTFEVFLNELGRLRDPDAHRRELLPHQKHLAVGISGEIRNRILRYRSRKETAQDCFPRIESARDSLGNIWVPGMPRDIIHKGTLRPGDRIELVVTASDPEGGQLDYALVSFATMFKWQESPEFEIVLSEEHIGVKQSMSLLIQSRRSYHAHSYPVCDDYIMFSYQVLPATKVE